MFSNVEFLHRANASLAFAVNVTQLRPLNHDYDDEDNGRPSDLIIVWEPAVMPLTESQRVVFFTLTTIVSIVAILGNSLVFYVNFTRKQRLLFRTCLISLALSDMIYTQVTTALYLPKLFISQTALWVLGSLTCALFPFLQTFGILVNSILLVCIAMDRYMAVVRIAKIQWEPGKLFCLTCCVLVWGMAAGVSSPMLTIYQYYRIYVVPLPDPDRDEDDDTPLDYYIGHACASNKDENAYYFSIIFSFIFAPLVMTFIWMNSVVAREIWNRRNSLHKSSPQSTTTTSTGELATQQVSASSIERKRRQVRLFKIILLLMAVFFVCRMPSWIYTIYKLNNDSDSNLEWMLSFSFGILALINCALNPYLYTFLSETIKLMSFLGNVFRGLFRSVFCFWRAKVENTA